MALIKDRRRARDHWQWLEAGADGAVTQLPESGNVIVPLAAWRASRGQLLARGSGIGVWLAGDDDPSELAPDLKHLNLIAVQFTSFTDGRGYSIARLLRQRYGWAGELRAIGDVQRDQLFYLARCGFDAFVMREGENVDEALAALDDFGEAYQAGVDRPLPLFRRRAQAPAA